MLKATTATFVGFCQNQPPLLAVSGNPSRLAFALSVIFPLRRLRDAKPCTEDTLLAAESFFG